MSHTPQDEQKHLKEVQGKLYAEIDEMNAALGNQQQEIVKMKKYFWENCNEFDEFGYEDYTNRQMIQSEINMAEDKMKKRQTYERLVKSPYFACVDFKYEGEETAESYYIGLAAFLPKKAFLPLIFDWRAPISGLFYDFDKGPAGFQTPQGYAKGEILHKLQYRITNGSMEFFFENDMKIDDDILMRELGTNANARLKSIVATIQREQNAIIRNENDRILVVQGAAGSGKTSVALHRIAYLLYHKRQELNSNNVMILTPNPIFSDYISQILPELGEEQILEMSFDEYARKELRDIARFETRYQQLEYLLETHTNKGDKLSWKQELIRYKQSREFLQELFGYVLELEETAVNWQDFECKNISQTSQELETLFYEKFPDVPVLRRLEVIADYIISEQETLDNKDMDPIRAEILKDKLLELYRTRNVRGLYYDFLVSLEKKAGLKLTEEFEPAETMIPYEDVYPLIYLKYLLFGTDAHRKVKHLVIDEMQDYTRVQYAILEKLFQCPMTILGDREQVSDGKESEVLRIIPKTFGRQVKILELKKSYRSTYEIGTFCARFLQPETAQEQGTKAGTDTEYFERHGRAPQLHSAETGGELAKQLAAAIAQQKSSYDTIAVLLRTQREADQLWRLLNPLLPCERLTEESDTFVTGVVVAPFYLAKGLEFDAVHVADVSADRYYATIHRQALYIACTRALHELDLYYTGEKSLLL